MTRSTSAKTAITKRQNAPPPMRTQSQTRVRPFSAINVECSTGTGLLLQRQHVEGAPGHTEFDWSLAGVFAVRINVNRDLGLDANAFGLFVVDFFKAEMTSEIHSGEKAKQPEGVHAANDADVEFAIAKIGFRSYFHPATVSRSVSDGRENCWMKVGIVITIARDFHAKWRETQELRRRTQCIAAARAKPLGQIIRASRNFSIDSDSGHAAEVVWRNLRHLLQRMNIRTHF